MDFMVGLPKVLTRQDSICMGVIVLRVLPGYTNSGALVTRPWIGSSSYGPVLVLGLLNLLVGRLSEITMVPSGHPLSQVCCNDRTQVGWWWWWSGHHDPSCHPILIFNLAIRFPLATCRNVFETLKAKTTRTTRNS
jgi:hypothetical protein